MNSLLFIFWAYWYIILLLAIIVVGYFIASRQGKEGSKKWNILKIFASIYFTIMGFFYIWGLTFWEGDRYSQYALHSLMETILEVPYTGTSSIYKESAYKVSYEEWMKFKCENKEFAKLKPSYFDIGLSSNYDLKNIPLEVKKQIQCVAPQTGYVTRHCRNMYTCNTIAIRFNEYILNYPELLEKVKAIAERPCELVKPLDPNDPDRRWIESERNHLFCKKLNIFKRIKYAENLEEKLLIILFEGFLKYFYPPEAIRRYIAIDIIDSDGNYKQTIKIKRKDLD
jgi:hypothetical protein